MKIFQQQFLRSQRSARGLLQALLRVCFVGVFFSPGTLFFLPYFISHSLLQYHNTDISTGLEHFNSKSNRI